MFEIGALVRDKRSAADARVVGVVDVPSSRDLLGEQVAAHRRYAVAFEDRGVITGEWNDNRREADLELIGSR